MRVSDVVLSSVQTLSPDTDLEDVFPEEFPDGLQHAPVLQDKQFLGFLPLFDLEIEREIHSKVGECTLEKTEVSALKNQHIFEVLPFFRKAGLPVLPVFGEEAMYEGILRLESVLEWFADAYSFSTEGGIVVLSMAQHSYSLAEISRLVESNQAKILSVVLETDPFSHMNLLVHIKLNISDVSRVVATLERFEYQVVEVFHKGATTSLDQERLDQLMKYLGI
jgi:hypothetical protein